MQATKPHISYSQMTNLRQCGESYRLKRIEKVEQRPSVPAVVGQVIHGGTETIDALIPDGSSDEAILTEAQTVVDGLLAAAVEVNSKVFPVEDWKRYGRATVEKPNGEDLSWFESVGIPNSLRAYLAWRRSSGLDVLDIEGFGPAVEVPFDLYMGDQPVHGYIDRVMHREGVPVLVDIKSGQKPKTDEQLGLYRQALLRGAGIDVTYGVYVYALKTGQWKLTSPLDLRHWTMEKLEKVYLQGSKVIELGMFLPQPGEQCFRCDVAHACAFSQAAI